MMLQQHSSRSPSSRTCSSDARAVARAAERSSPPPRRGGWGTDEEDPTAVETPPAETGADAPKEETEAPEPRASLATAPETSESDAGGGGGGGGRAAEPKRSLPGERDPFPFPRRRRFPRRSPPRSPPRSRRGGRKKKGRRKGTGAGTKPSRLVPWRAQAPSKPPPEELALAAAAARRRAAYDDAAAVLAEATRPSRAPDVRRAQKRACHGAGPRPGGPRAPRSAPGSLRRVLARARRKALAPAACVGRSGANPSKIPTPPTDATETRKRLFRTQRSFRRSAS